MLREATLSDPITKLLNSPFGGIGGFYPPIGVGAKPPIAAYDCY